MTESMDSQWVESLASHYVGPQLTIYNELMN